MTDEQGVGLHQEILNNLHTLSDSFIALTDKVGKLQTGGAVVETKVDGINKRLDTLNGTVADHVSKIYALEKSDVGTAAIINALTKKNDEDGKSKIDWSRWALRTLTISILGGVCTVVYVVLQRVHILNL